jgi:hypothetical protein
MNSSTFLPRAAAVLAAGGFAWLTKTAVITGTDGAVGDTANVVTGVLYITGVLLMPIGLAAVAVALTAGRPIVLRVLAGIGGFLAFFPIYLILESIAQAAVGNAGPTWLEDEVGILLTGVALMSAGLLAARRVRPTA